MNRLREEIRVIPTAAWVLAMLPTVVLLLWVTIEWDNVFRYRGELPVFILICVVFSVYLLTVGYVAGDARRRGMNVIPWVLLAFFAPSAIGVILYFILRAPLHRNCPQCGTSMSSMFAFCPSCGSATSKACPSCRSAVEASWAHCARCGTSLRPSQA
jgi:CDP-diglyceride synthetase